jgi:hypothetical protein
MNSTPLFGDRNRHSCPPTSALCALKTGSSKARRDTLEREKVAPGFAGGYLLRHLGLVTIEDGYLNKGIYLPKLVKGSIRYAELCALFLRVYQPPAAPRHTPRQIIYRRL